MCCPAFKRATPVPARASTFVQVPFRLFPALHSPTARPPTCPPFRGPNTASESSQHISGAHLTSSSPAARDNSSSFRCHTTLPRLSTSATAPSCTLLAVCAPFLAIPLLWRPTTSLPHPCLLRGTRESRICAVPSPHLPSPPSFGNRRNGACASNILSRVGSVSCSSAHPERKTTYRERMRIPERARALFQLHQPSAAPPRPCCISHFIPAPSATSPPALVARGICSLGRCSTRPTPLFRLHDDAPARALLLPAPLFWQPRGPARHSFRDSRGCCICAVLSPARASLSPPPL